MPGDISQPLAAAQQDPMVPAIVWGRGDHGLRQPLGVGDDTWCQWWPMLINPWRATWEGDETRWGECPDMAIYHGRPWPVHLSRIFIITNHIISEVVEPTNIHGACYVDGPIIEEVHESPTETPNSGGASSSMGRGASSSKPAIEGASRQTGIVRSAIKS